jgi:S1-C subfamily serine protease
MLTAASALSGCGKDDKPSDPTAATSSGPQPVASVEAPDPKLADAPAVATARTSVLKIQGDSPKCELGGAGFVVAPNRVMTPAHVVSGSKALTVEADGKTLDAHVVSYDTHRDLAILDVPNLPAAPLSFAAEEAVAGSDAIVLGYSDEGDFTVIPARIREVITLDGPDMYNTTKVSRGVYIINGNPEDGSGGPLIDRDGQVLGVTFGADVDDPDTGFALTAKEIEPQLAELTNTVPVPTGSEKC